MNATCPRCGTIILVSHDAKRYKCPTCRARYCRRCQHWKEAGEKYCQECALSFLAPPNAIHTSVKQSATLALLFVVLIAVFFRTWSPWYGLAYSLIILGVYFTIYLVRFQRSTLLVWAVRREALVVFRQGIIWGTIACFLIMRGSATALGLLVVGTLLATVLGLLIINRLNTRVMDEMRAHRATWKAVLEMRAMDALLLRFPAAYLS